MVASCVVQRFVCLVFIFCCLLCIHHTAAAAVVHYILCLYYLRNGDCSAVAYGKDWQCLAHTMFCIKLSLISIKSMLHKSIQCTRSTVRCAHSLRELNVIITEHIWHIPRTPHHTTHYTGDTFCKFEHYLHALIVTAAPGNQCKLCTTNATFFSVPFPPFCCKTTLYGIWLLHPKAN